MNLPDFSQSRVLVFGDVMLDRYWTGNTSRISPEAPVPIVKISATDNRLGGAGNVALNLAHLGCKTSLFGIIGSDKAGTIVCELLNDAGIQHDLYRDPARSTITKLRVMSQQQQLIRLDFEERLHEAENALALTGIETEIDCCDAVVISDYAKGTVKDPEYLIELCRNKNIPVLVDPKGKDYSRYRGATALTPNRNELELIIGKHTSLESLFQSARALCEELDINALIVTLSEKGMALIRQHAEPLHIATRAREVFDVTGAGDTVISMLAAATACKLELSEAMQLANTAAGIVVGKSGTATVTPQELLADSTEDFAPQSKLTDLASLKNECELARSRGEKIVFTNGCFDILHAGHVRYLQQAASYGDKLIVALNSDASVKKLKGDARPINPLQSRMDVIAGLACVDRVIAFEEDTPATLIQTIKPNVLAKGGDYRAEDIVGYDTVRQNGGKVIVVPFHEHHSTSDMIEKIRN